MFVLYKVYTADTQLEINRSKRGALAVPNTAAWSPVVDVRVTDGPASEETENMINEVRQEKMGGRKEDKTGRCVDKAREG